MSSDPGNAAAIPNPALQPWSVLVGEWDTVGSHRLLPGVPLHGRTSFAWLEGGAYLVMRTQVEAEGFPDAVAIFGSDDEMDSFYVLYFDERGVSRKYEAALRDNTWKQWREAPSFSQRFTGAIAENGDRIHGVWEISEDGSTWKQDFELTFTRIK